MDLVIPRKEAGREAAGLVKSAFEPAGKSGGVFHRFELTFGERIVVAYVRAAAALGHIKSVVQAHHGGGLHRGAIIRVNRQLAWLDVSLFRAERYRANGGPWCRTFVFIRCCFRFRGFRSRCRFRKTPVIGGSRNPQDDAAGRHADFRAKLLNAKLSIF